MSGVSRKVQAALGSARAARARVSAAARILNMGRARAAAHIIARAFAGIPEEPLRSYLLPDLTVERCERVDDNTLRIFLKNGRAFAGERSHQKEYALYNVFKHELLAEIDADSYELGLDIQQRYLEVRLPRYCRNGGIFIEGGCYTGMKAIRWHDLCPKSCRILAVEMGSRNYELLCANIESNGLTGSIIPVHAGLWFESGEGIHRASYSTRHFLEATDQWQNEMRHPEKIRLITLDDLLEEHNVQLAEYVNIQVNGAEIQVLRGLKRGLDRIKIIDIASYYSQGGNRNVEIVRAMLMELGCRILHETPAGRIRAVTPRFREKIRR